jgi:hypothetical protein
LVRRKPPVIGDHLRFWGVLYLESTLPRADTGILPGEGRSKHLKGNLSQGKIPKKVLSHGEFVPLKKITEDLKLGEILSGVMPSKEVWPVLTLAMNFALRPRALTHIQSWYEGTILSEDHPDISYPLRAFLEC